ncbi:MAG: hypothetical protein JXB42_10165 [Deltaproteobacteria bacterium]|nr:hypothetical protein [Deltaproteobacteria bacterium]
MSIFAWVTFVFCSLAVLYYYLTTGNSQFLLFAIPGLILLIVIPMTLAWMSRRSYAQAADQYINRCRSFKIANISLGTTGTAVRVSGSVQKVSFRWLNRPHFIVKDETGAIRIIMFTSPSEDIKTGDSVDVLGVVIKNIFSRRAPAISAVSIEKVKKDHRRL